MQVEMSLREFAPLAGGPGGIQKLRELVLQLAVRGKLVPQIPAEGDASELLSKLKKRFHQENKKSEYPQSSPLFNVPASWRWTTMAGIGRIVGGGTPKSGVAAYFSEPGIPWLTPADLYGFSAKYIGHGKRSISKLGLAESSAQLLPAGSVLFSSRAPIGYSAIAANPLATNQGFKSCVPYVDGMSEFILIYLRASIMEFEARASGTTFMEVSGKVVSGVPFPLPPLAEQKRIVAKVDELMALCDELETRQRQETRLKRAASASALHQLTEAKSSQETDDRWSLIAPRFGELFDDLETIKTLRVAITDAAANRAFSTPSERANIVQGTVDDVLVSSNSGWSPRCDNVPATGDEWGVLKVSAVTWGVFKPEENKRLPSDMEPRPQHALSAGDILVSRANTAELVGRGVKVPEDYPRLILSDKIVRLVLSDAVLPDYFLLAFHASPVRAYLAKVATGTSDSMRNITRNHIKSAPIALPLIAEQKRIVAKFDELMALCARLEEQVREGERLNADLMASLVHALTETDPDGGGAVELVGFIDEASTAAAPEQANKRSPEMPGTKSAYTASKPTPKTRTILTRTLGVDTKFQEAVLVAAIVNTFFQAGGEPIGNFRLQKAVYFARRQMGEHVGEMAYLKKAAGPYNPSMKYSGGIAIAKQKNWLREARGRFGFGHVPGADVGYASEWIDAYRYDTPVRWVAEHFRYKKNEEWETLATVDYAIEHLQTLSIKPDAAQILHYIASDPEWRPKIEKLGLTEMSVGSAMLEVQALFSAKGRDNLV